MRFPIEFENDFHEYSKAERVSLVVILVLVTLVVISWVSQGFALNETRNVEYSSNIGQTIEHKASTPESIIHSASERN